MVNKKNKLLITIDGIRKDRIPCYRQDAAHIMPNIARIAPESFIFDNMIAAATSTGMCFSSIFTGRYNKDFGRKTYGDNRNPFSDNLFSDFEEKGYKTFCCLNRRFEVHSNLVNAFSKAQFLWTGNPVKDASIREKDKSSLRPFEQVEYLHNFLKSQNSPWLVWVHLWGFSRPLDKFLKINGFEYDGRIREMDEAIGFLFDKYKNSSDIFIFADHGYAFFEKNKWSYGKDGSNLVNQVIEVPFLFYDGVHQGHNENLVSQVRIRNIINGKDNVEKICDEQCFCETRYIEQKDKTLAIRQKTYKLVYSYDKGISEFYDLSTDPSETINYTLASFHKLCRDKEGNVPRKKPYILRNDWQDIFKEYEGLLISAVNFYNTGEHVNINVTLRDNMGEIFVEIEPQKRNVVNDGLIGKIFSWKKRD